MMMVSSIHARKFELNRHLSRNSKRREKIQALVINMTLIAALIAYSFMGAAIFWALEHPEEMKEYEELQDTRELFKEWIENLTRNAINDNFNDTRNMSQFIADSLDKFEESFSQKACHHHIDRTGKAQWNFYSSLFFSATVITMIGYGNVAPVTVSGRAFCMVYAVFGIALLLLVLASLGTLFARGATLAYRAMHLSVMMAKGEEKIKPKKARRRSSLAMVLRDRDEDKAPERQTSTEERRQKTIDDTWDTDYKHPDDKDLHIVNMRDERAELQRQKTMEKEEEEENEDDIQIPVLGVLMFCLLYICMVAGLLIIWEDWNYFEAFYFSFITLTTIGFGDLVPQHQKNLLTITFFILLGMAIMSMCIALAQDAIMKRVAWASEKIGVALIKKNPTGK